MAKKSRDRDCALYLRALAILEGRSNGHALPVLRRLTLRGFAPAVNLMSDHVVDREAVRLLRREARKGDPLSAYNLAVTYRNLGDMLNYRRALARAARLDPEAAEEMASFKTRFPHSVMRRFRRLEPAPRD